jgi:hypothetical protein
LIKREEVDNFYSKRLCTDLSKKIYIFEGISDDSTICIWMLKTKSVLRFKENDPVNSFKFSDLGHLRGFLECK